jgi:hypothetical protein
MRFFQRTSAGLLWSYYSLYKRYSLVSGLLSLLAYGRKGQQVNKLNMFHLARPSKANFTWFQPNPISDPDIYLNDGKSCSNS